MNRLRLICFLSLICISTACRADNLHLPLNGYYHPGRYMPVECDFAPGTSSLQISSNHAVTTVVDQPSPHLILPFLPLGPLAAPLQWKTPSNVGQIPLENLHALAPDEKLIATDSDDQAIAHALFPGQTVMPIRLNSIDPLQGSGSAWESLDAIMVQPDSWERIPSATKSSLYAGGTVLAVVSTTEPREKFDWQQRGNIWLADSKMVPLPVVDPDAYTPTYAWQPGRPNRYRAAIVLLGVLTCILAGGVALWRSRWMPMLQIALGGGAVLTCSAWNSQQSPVQIMQSVILVNHADRSTEDEWYFLSTRRDAVFDLPVNTAAHPIFYDQTSEPALQLTCDSAGNPLKISGRLKRDWPLVIID